MLLCINAIHGGLISGCWAFAFFVMPGAIGMYGLSIGIAKVGDSFPDPVYALLSGLNAATVGIIALSAVNLAGRAVTDRITRLLVFFGGGLGMLYTALWYYPVIMAAAGLGTLTWDSRTRISASTIEPIVGLWSSYKDRWRSSAKQTETNGHERPRSHAGFPAVSRLSHITGNHSTGRSRSNAISVLPTCEQFREDGSSQLDTTTALPSFPTLISRITGSLLLLIFASSFLAIILVRALVPNLSRLYNLFSSLYLAGTIIFGGGPVVIPLLQQYAVSPGWVSSRDFLLGLAVIQAFPGPNFNFAVYLGALATQGTGVHSFAGAVVAFLGIFTPGMVVTIGFLGWWKKMQEKKWFLSILRGVNAAAVGLVFTAVYKLWQIGHVGGSTGNPMMETSDRGSPLGGDAWLVFIVAAAFVGGKWFCINAPVAILLGGIAGISRWAIFPR
ncbi:MAG: hypothetical protein Q9174_006827 [Haloplaca sp. 1 TL-2023]